MANSQGTLEMFMQRASRYAISLNGRVRREDNRPILRGGSAVVYRGTLQTDGTKVAIKVTRCEPPEDEDTIGRVLEEVHICSKLNHENVLRVLGITSDFKETVSIVSPWMEKGDAHDFVQDEDHDPRPLMMDIARGLRYLHTRPEGRIIHGDLKGRNVLISDSGRALLTDFGLSLLGNSTFSISLPPKSGMSLNWSAPEIVDNPDGNEKTAAADIWSFGMTLLELFTRKIPFHQSNGYKALIGQIMQGKTPERPSSEETYRRLTDPWWDICFKCWKDEPESRPTIEDVLQEITILRHNEQH